MSANIALPTHIRIEDDFDLEKIRLSGQCFRVSKLEDDIYRFIAGEHVLFIRNDGEFEYSISCDRAEWDAFWHGYFDMDRNYASIRKRCEGKSPFLDTAMVFGRGLRVLKQDPWEMLITFIISQRKNIPAISKSVETLAKMFGHEIGNATRKDTGEMADADNAAYDAIYSFPSPEELGLASEADLRNCSLGYRAPYIHETTRQIIAGEIDLNEIAALSDAELFTELQRAHGVGAKVANCVCLFGYGRTSQVPVDVWIARAIEDECSGKEPFSQFGEDAGIMQQYAFYYMTNRNKG